MSAEETNPYGAPASPADQGPAPDPESATAASRSRWHLGLNRVPRAALVGGVAFGLALGGAGLAFAATSSTSTPSSTSSSSGSGSSSTPVAPATRPHAGRFGMGRRFGPGAPGLGALGGLIHGVGTVKTSSGYKTVEFQVGQVTSVSRSAITLKSVDGYTHTYTVTPTTVVDSQAGGISSVAVKDQITLVSSTVSGKDTATNISDQSKLGASRHAFGFGPAGGAPAGGAPTGPAGGSPAGTSGYTFGGGQPL